MPDPAPHDPSIQIRRAQVSDVAAIAPLVAAYWDYERIAGFERARVEAHLSTLLSGPERGGCWVAEHDAALAGYLIAVYVFSLEHGGLMAEIDEFYLRPHARHFGAGSALLAESEREMAAAGISRVQLQVGVRNDQARGFYERRGYRRRSAYDLYDKPLSDK
ncbi:MAG: GNAT family N-acetyltransferase [Steroidobacteraceae bacterium]|jgi:ribosomal protein S18 acetylase RimI-like enzyme